MDLRKLKTLVDLVSESNISELEITEADGKVRIVKADPFAASRPTMAAPSPGLAAAPVAEPPPTPSNAGTATAADAGSDEEPLHIVKAPMVGTFYRTSSPGTQPFVEIGSQIQEGEPICIIEAMKIMNEIEADMSGVVSRILCESGQAVEYGQPLFAIEDRRKSTT
ncbi:MAG: acetyl-CoA carboxylase biotin carboxyl carrier protein [Burkholderiaceae bacterium]|nr:acetyl-CoA carboxylase biotin carboxyl carrier protein [Burkholderiaceae bacterium]